MGLFKYENRYTDKVLNNNSAIDPLSTKADAAIDAVVKPMTYTN